MERVRVFVTHKTNHKSEAERIIEALEPFGAGRLEFFLAEKDIPAGVPWRQHIKDNIRDAHILLFIVPKSDADWTWPIFEAGLFEGSPKDAQNFSHIVLLYSPAVEIPKPLEDLQAVKAIEDDMAEFLRKFFGTTEITNIESPLNPAFVNNETLLRQTARTVCQLFSEEKADIISCLPHMAIQVDNPSKITADSIPDDAVIDAEIDALAIFGLTNILIPGKLTLTWSDFINHLGQDYDNWFKPLTKVIDQYNRGKRPRNEQITFRTDEDKIYLSSLHKIEYLGDGGRRFNIIFAPQVSEGLFVYVPDRYATLLTCLILGSRLEWEVCEKFLTRLKSWPIEEREREKIFNQIREAIANIEGEARYRQNELSKKVNDDRLLAVFSSATDIRNELEENLDAQQGLKDFLSSLTSDIHEADIKSALEKLYGLNRRVMLIVSDEYNSLIRVR